MLDDASAGAPTPAPRCTWCSAELPSDHEATCPSCGATLLGDGDAAVPGLTAIDAEAILRNARAAKAKPRSRLLGWISGEYDEEGTSGAAPAPGSLAPPPVEVRREMLRLELEAQVANAQAEVESLAVDAAIEEGATSLEALAATPRGEGDGEATDRAVPQASAAAEQTARGDAAPGAETHDDDEAPPA